MAALLGLVTGVLAFIPNIGAITSGVLMVAVGFSAGPHQGVYAIFVYFFVQNIDGYLVVPYIARRTVDFAPAMVLAMQLLMGALFGILGVLFADPILATLKVVLVDLSKQHAARGGRRAGSRRGAICRGACCCAAALPHHRRAAAHDLPHPDVEGQVAVLREARRRRAVRRTPACCGMVKRYSPPSFIRVIASAKPGNTWPMVNGWAPPWFSLLSNTVPSSSVPDIIEQRRVRRGGSARRCRP